MTEQTTLERFSTRLRRIEEKVDHISQAIDEDDGELSDKALAALKHARATPESEYVPLDEI